MSPRRALCLLTIASFITVAAAFSAAPATAQTDNPELNRAIAEISEGRVVEAVEILEALLGSSDDPAIPGILGGLYLEQGRDAEAIELLRPIADAPDAEPAGLYNAGRAALAVGDVESALRYLTRSVQLVPMSPAQRELGLLRGQMGFFEESYLLLRPWTQQNPDDYEARLAAALCAVQLERVPDAEELLSDLPQESAGVRLLWGKLLLQKGEPWGAIGSLKPLLENPLPEMELDIRRTLAQGYLMVGQAEDAVQLLEGQIESDPPAALQLSHAQYQTGEVDAALATLRPYAERIAEEGDEIAQGRGLSLAAGLTQEYGRLLVASGRAADAVPYLQLATEYEPGSKQAWQALGQALAGAGQTEEAKVALERFQEIAQNEVPAASKELALERDIEDPTGRKLREALSLLAQNRPDEALLIVRREAQIATGDPRPRLLESRTLLALDRKDEALQAAQIALGIAPENADAHYQQGSVQMARDQLDEAEQSLRRALTLAPDHIPSLNDLAVLLLHKGEAGEARQLLERVLELRPDDVLAKQNLDGL